eukprot:scaffold36972_cov27-Prasinocladus_malaysianus.AAC.6
MRSNAAHYTGRFKKPGKGNDYTESEAAHDTERPGGPVPLTTLTRSCTSLTIPSDAEKTGK